MSLNGALRRINIELLDLRDPRLELGQFLLVLLQVGAGEVLDSGSSAISASHAMNSLYSSFRSELKCKVIFSCCLWSNPAVAGSSASPSASDPLAEQQHDCFAGD